MSSPELVDRTPSSSTVQQGANLTLTNSPLCHDEMHRMVAALSDTLPGSFSQRMPGIQCLILAIIYHPTRLVDCVTRGPLECHPPNKQALSQEGQHEFAGPCQWHSWKIQLKFKFQNSALDICKLIQFYQTNFEFSFFLKSLWLRCQLFGFQLIGC